MKKKRINANKKAQIIKKYNLTSHFYDKRYLKIQNEKFEVILRNYELNDKIVLDAGCGTGLLLDFFANSIEHLESKKFFYVGLDISINMLESFYSKVKSLKNWKVNLILADLENLPIRDNVFKSIFSLTSLQNLPNMNVGVNELFRVAQYNADLGFSILKKSIDISKLITFLKTKIKHLEVIIEDFIEDVMILGNKF